MNPRRLALVVSVCGLAGLFVGLIASYISGPFSVSEPGEARKLPSSLQLVSSSQEATADSEFQPVVADPVEAIRLALLHTSFLHRRFEMAQIAARMTEEELRRLLDGMSDTELKDYEKRILLLQVWAEKDPVAAANYAAEIKGTRDEQRYIAGSLIRFWAIRDPLATFAWVSKSSSQDRLYLLREIADSYFSVGNVNAVQFIQTAISTFKEVSPGHSLDNGRIAELFGYWAKHDPAAAAAFVRSAPDAKTKNAWMLSVLGGWAGVDPGEALRRFNELEFTDAVERETAAEAFAGRLAAKDARLAVEFAEAQPPGNTRARALGEVAEQLLENDLKAALETADRVPIADTYGLVYSFYESWSQKDPSAVLRHCFERVTAMEPGSGARKNVLSLFESNFLNEGVERDPRNTAEFYAGPFMSEHPEVLSRVLLQWTMREPQDAAAWVDSLPEGTARDYALVGMAQAKAGQSVTETVDWLRSLPKDSTYAAAVEGFAAEAFAQDPSGALAWIHSIPDPAERQRRLQGAWSKWATSYRSQDRSAAARWRDSSTELSAQERQALASPLPSKSPLSSKLGIVVGEPL